MATAIEPAPAPTQGVLELPKPASPNRATFDLSRDQARAELIDLRENTIKAAFPDADPARGLLRKSLLDELLRKRPKDASEFLSKIPIELRQSTDADQLKRFGEAVFEILERTT